MQNPDKLLKEINRSLDDSMAALNNSGAVDMVSLDTKVREFCALIPQLPPVEAKSCKEQLLVVVNRLNEIVEKMSTRRSEIEVKVDELNQRNRAQNAYGNANINANNFNEAE